MFPNPIAEPATAAITPNLPEKLSRDFIKLRVKRDGLAPDVFDTVHQELNFLFFWC